MKFLVSETYQQITPESCDQVDFSDIGYNFKDHEYTLRELIDYIKRSGYHLRSKNDFTPWLSTNFYCICYKTATEESISLHVKLKDN